MDWRRLSDRILAGESADRTDAMAVLESHDSEILGVLDAAYQLRRKHHGQAVNLHVINNARSGHCSENCSFCSQSAVSTAQIEQYELRSADELVDGARRAFELGAVKYCMVTSGRSPEARDIDVICDAVRRIKAEVRLHLCVSPGLLNEEQARQLAQAGVDRVNHNLETARRHFPEICGTHAYEDRVSTVRAVKAAGMEVCCGGIMGLGETLEDRVDFAFTLRELEVEAIPVNFFNPRPGTPLGHMPRLKAYDGLRALAMMRLVNPTRDIRAAGGREVCLGSLQPLALYAANSIFTKGYLTTPGQGNAADLEMIGDAGFTLGRIEG